MDLSNIIFLYLRHHKISLVNNIFCLVNVRQDILKQRLTVQWSVRVYGLLEVDPLKGFSEV